MYFSLTKLFTATAILQLAERGLVDIDRPVQAYLPEFSIDNPFRRDVTLRHLLSHSSGLANPVPISWIHLAAERGPTLNEMAKRLIAKHRRLRFEPGSKYSYSNLGYLALVR